jgi:hypothetical protein
MEQTLSDAINTLKRVTIWYNGGYRTIEPHTLGFGANMQMLLRAYQLDGHSNSDKPVAWKLLSVNKLRNVAANGETFASPRPGYCQGDKAMKSGIIAQL